MVDKNTDNCKKCYRKLVEIFMWITVGVWLTLIGVGIYTSTDLEVVLFKLMLGLGGLAAWLLIIEKWFEGYYELS